MDNKTMLIVLAAVAVYFLFIRKPAAAAAGYRQPAPAAYRPPQPQPQSAGQQAIQAGASALGSFLGQWARGAQGSSASSDDSWSSPANSGGTNFADDSWDSDSYAFS